MQKQIRQQATSKLDNFLEVIFKIFIAFFGVMRDGRRTEDPNYSIVTCCGADILSAQAARLSLGYQDVEEVKGQQPTPFLSWPMTGQEKSKWRGREDRLL